MNSTWFSLFVIFFLDLLTGNAWRTHGGIRCSKFWKEWVDRRTDGQFESQHWLEICSLFYGEHGMAIVIFLLFLRIVILECHLVPLMLMQWGAVWCQCGCRNATEIVLLVHWKLDTLRVEEGRGGEERGGVTGPWYLLQNIKILRGRGRRGGELYIQNYQNFVISKSECRGC